MVSSLFLWGEICGFYWWIWESNPNAGGLNDTDFTPQNKPVEYLIKSRYSSERPHIEETSAFPWATICITISVAAIVVLTSALVVTLRKKRLLQN